MVASSRSTSESSRSTASDEAEVFLRSAAMSLCEREKNEVSAPETRAETSSRQQVTRHNAARWGEKPWKVIQGIEVSKGSGR